MKIMRFLVLFTFVPTFLYAKAAAVERIDNAALVLDEIMAVPEKSIPRDLLERAQCIGIIPGLKKGGFVVGGKYGKGVILCRGPKDAGWTAPSTVRIEGGSFGLQIGGGEVDVIFLVMNKSGAEKLRKSRFTVGGDMGAMAGPVGREASADTDLYFRAQILSYSRSRGIFAGIVLDGATLRADDADNDTIYGKPYTHEQILTGQIPPTKEGQLLISKLNVYSARKQD